MNHILLLQCMVTSARMMTKIYKISQSRSVSGTHQGRSHKIRRFNEHLKVMFDTSESVWSVGCESLETQLLDDSSGSLSFCIGCKFLEGELLTDGEDVCLCEKALRCSQFSTSMRSLCPCVAVTCHLCELPELHG